MDKDTTNETKSQGPSPEGKAAAGGRPQLTQDHYDARREMIQAGFPCFPCAGWGSTGEDKKHACGFKTGAPGTRKTADNAMDGDDRPWGVVPGPVCVVMDVDYMPANEPFLSACEARRTRPFFSGKTRNGVHHWFLAQEGGEYPQRKFRIEGFEAPDKDGGECGDTRFDHGHVRLWGYEDALMDAYREILDDEAHTLPPDLHASLLVPERGLKKPDGTSTTSAGGYGRYTPKQVERVVNAVAERAGKSVTIRSDGQWAVGNGGGSSVISPDGLYKNWDGSASGQLADFAAAELGITDTHEALNFVERLTAKPLTLNEEVGGMVREEMRAQVNEELQEWLDMPLTELMVPKPPHREPPLPVAVPWAIPKADAILVDELRVEMAQSAADDKEAKRLMGRIRSIIKQAEEAKKVQDQYASRTGNLPDAVIPENDVSLARCVANSTDPQRPRWSPENRRWYRRVPNIKGVVFEPIEQGAAETWIRQKVEGFYRKVEPLASVPPVDANFDPQTRKRADGEHMKPLTSRKEGMGQRLAAEVRESLESPNSPLAVWEGDPRIVGFRDGMKVDLRMSTLTLGVATEDDGVFSPLPASPDFEAEYGNDTYWRKMMNNMAGGDEHAELSLVSHIASMVFPYCFEQCLFAVGPTRGGKTELGLLLERVAPGRIGKASHDLFFAAKGGFDNAVKRDSNRALLAGCSGYTVAETSDQALLRLNESVYKAVNSKDLQEGRKNGGGNMVEYPGRMNGIVWTNKLPPASADPAVHERTAIMLVPQIPKKDRIPDISKKVDLTEATTDIIRALHEMVRRGGAKPPQAEAWAAHKRDWVASAQEADPHQGFVRERVEITGKHSDEVKPKDLLEAYNEWVRSNDLKPLSGSGYKQLLVDNGIFVQHTKKGNIINGIRLV